MSEKRVVTMRLGAPLVSLVLAVTIASALVGIAHLVPTTAEAGEQMVVQGVVWYDDNQNGVFDPGEQSAPEATIQVYVSGGKYPSSVASAVADSTGGFQVSFPRDAGRDPTLLVSVLRPGYPYPSGVSTNFSGSAPILPGTAEPTTVNVPLRPAYRGVTVRLPAGSSADFEILGGHFFTQTNGFVGGSGIGFSITNADGVPFWDTWQQLGLLNVGYPISQRFVWKGFLTQVFQKAAFQWQPGRGLFFVNIFDELHQRGADPWLQVHLATPPQIDPSFDAAKSSDEVVQGRLALLDDDPAIRRRYFATPNPLLQYGLPTSRITDLGSVVVIRTQRTVFQRWKVDVPWARAGEVTIANGGDISKDLGLFPLEPLIPQPPP